MILDFIINSSASVITWLLSFLPTIGTEISSVNSTLTGAFDFFVSAVATGMYILPFLETAFTVIGLIITFHIGIFLLTTLSWIASLFPFSPIKQWHKG